MKTYPFRPWVRSTCRRAMLWGIGVLALIAAISWLFREPGSAHLGRAFGSLLFYGSLFWLSLLKIWWTAGQPAVLLTDEALGHQSVVRFRPTWIPYRAIDLCAPRKGTQSQRFVFADRRGRQREFFLNLAVVKGRNSLLNELGLRLTEHGLEPLDERHAWARPGALDDDS